MNVQMSRAEFFEKFDLCNNLSEQINLLKTTTYDMYAKEANPTYICERFLIYSKDAALEAAKAMVQRFGNIIVDRRRSRLQRRICTIVESLEHVRAEYKFANSEDGDDWFVFDELTNQKYIDDKWVSCQELPEKEYRCACFLDAFGFLGMSAASEYNEFTIFYIYESGIADDGYDELYGKPNIEPKTDLKRELIEYLHQPRFIAKWIESGDNDLLEYLE